MSTLTFSIPRAFLGLAIPFAVLAAPPARAQSADTSFFVTSVGIGNGGNLGGLAGADNQCQTLAQAAGGSATASAIGDTDGVHRGSGGQ